MRDAGGDVRDGASAGFIDIGYRIEYEWVGPAPAAAPTAVLLHHGLGSVSAWGGFPRRVASAIGFGVLAYSRRGYGLSAPADPFPWGAEFMHRAARDELPRLLSELEIERPLLIGHSDGASIAIIYAASGLSPAPSGLVLLAPHVFVEPETIAGALRARAQFENGELRSGLARHHADPESAFYGWFTSWHQPGFRDWNIEAEVEHIQCPVTVVQGVDDEYGTLAQVESIRARLPSEPTVIVLEDTGHAPHREHPKAVVQAIKRAAEESGPRGPRRERAGAGCSEPCSGRPTTR